MKEQKQFDLIFSALIRHHGRINFRKEELGQFFYGSDVLVDDCVNAGWITPKVEGNRLVGFDLYDIIHCLFRFSKEGRPRKSGPSQESPKQP